MTSSSIPVSSCWQQRHFIRSHPAGDNVILSGLILLATSSFYPISSCWRRRHFIRSYPAGNNVILSDLILLATSSFYPVSSCWRRRHFIRSHPAGDVAVIFYQHFFLYQTLKAGYRSCLVLGVPYSSAHAPIPKKESGSKSCNDGITTTAVIKWIEFSP